MPSRRPGAPDQVRRCRAATFRSGPRYIERTSMGCSSDDASSLRGEPRRPATLNTGDGRWARRTGGAARRLPLSPRVPDIRDGQQRPSVVAAVAEPEIEGRALRREDAALPTRARQQGWPADAHRASMGRLVGRCAAAQMHPRPAAVSVGPDCRPQLPPLSSVRATVRRSLTTPTDDQPRR